ncbi:ABC transporter permease [Flavitalea antarctica]
MLINYFKIAWRNLVKNKLHTAINIGGLIIGFTIGILVIMTVYWQLNADKFHVARKKLYQAYQVYNLKNGEQVNNQFDFAPAQVFRAEAPAIEKLSSVGYAGSKVLYGDKELDIPVTVVSSDFLSMFTFPVITSAKANPLSELTDVVITEPVAKKIFGKADPVGKTIKVEMGDNLLDLVVSAVLKEIPNNSSIKFEVLTRVENRSDYAQRRNSWENSFQNIYVQLKDGATASDAEKELKQINQKYLAREYKDLQAKGARPDSRGDIFATRLLPMDEVHFSTRVNHGRAVSPLQVYSVLTVGLLIILIASFNFININLANAFTRTKEIGVRKCLGAARSKLFSQLWSESFIVCLISFVLSLMLVHILIGTVGVKFNLNYSFTEVLWKPDFLLLGAGLLLFVSLIAGGYPSWIMMRFKVVETLKGNLTIKRKSILRNSLIVVQFTIACIMISCTYIIYQQFQHLQNANLGIETTQLISVPLSNPDKGHATVDKLRLKLASDPHIASVTGSSVNIGKGLDRRSTKSAINFDYEGKEIHTVLASVDYDYAITFGLKLIDGRDFQKGFAGDTLQNVVLTESAAKQFGKQNLVGQHIRLDSNSTPWHVIGVIPDFHMYSMREEIQPLTLTLNKKDRLNYLFVKTSSTNLVAGMKAVKEAMAELEPGVEFRGTYVDDNVARWYDEEQTMSVVFSIAAGVSTLLSCMGLLAMVLLIIQQRVKEIGVRKVLGASIKSISFLISKDFVILVLIAVVIATPVSWLIMNAWLQDFPYRISLQLWMFGLIAIGALIIALLTICVNTIKAARQNPVNSLRTE